MNQIISFSGGKDSTAMALLMLEKGEPIHSVMAFDTGWEFPQMLEHWQQFEEYTGLEIVRLYPRESFEYLMLDRPLKTRNPNAKGSKGYGWPSAMRRWCTREKVAATKRYYKTVESPVVCIGFAADESGRAQGITLNKKKVPSRFPLIEWGIDEDAALKICKRHGFHWGGLYDQFRRVSCFCCPLQRLGELRTLRREYPELWQRMLGWDKRRPSYNPGFKDRTTLHDLDRRFAEEDKQHKCCISRR